MADRAGTLRRDVSVFAVLARGRVRSELQYRTSFGFLLAGEVLSTLVDLAAIVALFSKVGSLGGWRRADVLVLYGVTTTSFAFTDALLSPIGRLPEWVRLGRFDRLLVRPAGVLVQLLGHEFQLRRFGKLAQPVVTLVLAWRAAGVAVSARTVGLAVFAIVGSAVTLAALFVVTTSIAFWSPDSEEVANAFTYGGELAGQYPVHVYTTWLRRWLFTIVPIGLTSYAPVAAIVDAPNPLGLPTWVRVAGPLAAVPAALVAAVVWRTGTRRYASTGS